jgi:hypothetical protein
MFNRGSPLRNGASPRRNVSARPTSCAYRPKSANSLQTTNHSSGALKDRVGRSGLNELKHTKDVLMNLTAELSEANLDKKDLQ